MNATPSLRFPRVLVTGAAGFAGRHLVRELLAAGHEVLCTDALPADAPAAAGLPGYAAADLRDAEAVRALVRAAAPDAVAHLAAVSFVPDAARDPAFLWNVNIGGVANVADAVLAERPSARVLFISTAQVYGTPPPPAPGSPPPAPLTEDAPLQPLSLYAVSKVAGEALLRGRAAARGLDAVVARPGNHTGPGQSPKFVAVSFARQVLAAKAGEPGPIRVGNLDSARDFSDVRDVVRAYRLLLERGEAGEVCNVSSGAVVRIGDLLDRLRALAGVDAPAVRDDALWRPADACLTLDTSRLRARTGWEPRVALDDTLRDILAALSS